MCGQTDYLCIKQHSRFAVDMWLHLHGTMVDGANDYRTQAVIADSLLNSGVAREDVFITTKCPGAIGYEAIMQCADDNLQMLEQFGSAGVGYIDLLLIHFPFTLKPACRFHRDSSACSSPTLPANKTQLQESWRAMEDLKRFGVVKAIGVSNYNVTNLQDTLETAKEPIEVNQVEWNPKTHDEGLLAFATQHSILLQAYSPLGGALQGGSVLSNPTLQSIANAHNRSAPQVALRWAIQRGIGVVVGTDNPAHVASDIDIFDFQLTADEVRNISSIQMVRRESAAPIFL